MGKGRPGPSRAEQREATEITGQIRDASSEETGEDESQAAQAGSGPLLALIAILSANLSLMNLLPIPVLDGGALLFCAAELVLRRKLPARAQAFGTRAGVAILGSLFMFTTLHDLAQIGLFRWIASL